MTNLDKQCSSTIIATFTYHAEMVLELEFLYEYWIEFVTMKLCMSKLRSLSSYMIGAFRTPELIVIVLWCHGMEPLVSDIVGRCFKTKFYTTPGLYVLLIYIITVVRLMKPTAVGFIRYGRRRSDRITTTRFVW